MSDILNSENRTVQYNGPVNSADFNLRAEQNYRDLVHLYNRSGILDQKLSEAFERVLKDHHFLSMAVLDLEDRVKALEYNSESEYKKMSIYTYSQIDVASFVGDPTFAVSSTDALSFDYVYNIITLPKLQSSSQSKLKFFDSSGAQVIPDFLETKVDNAFVGVDTAGSLIDTTPIYYSFLESSDKFWKRNVIVDTPSAAGAQIYLYVKIPSSFSGSAASNFLSLIPYPIFGVDIVSIEYSADPNPNLDINDKWTPLNFNRLYNNQPEATGKVPPGGWSTVGGDIVLNAGPVGFYFPSIEINALTIALRQRNYTTEHGKCVYTYGLSDMDLRSQKCLDSGKTIIKFTAPNNDTILNVEEVIPKIYNVPEELISTAFNYRVIYKQGSSYTLDPVPGSTSVWIEVTLNKLGDGTAPVLSDLIVNYT